MIERSTEWIPVNDGTGEALTRDQIWATYLWKAQRADLFVEVIQQCRVIERYQDGFLREIVHPAGTGPGTERLQERIFLEPQGRISFVRLGGGTPGIIFNDLRGTGSDLAMRFSFSLSLVGEEHDSDAERDFGDGFLRAYARVGDKLVAAGRRYAAAGLEHPAFA